MIKIKGKYNTAQVFTLKLEETAAEQILELCNQEFVAGSTIRIMPDTHAGAGCTIGTTMTIKDKIVPNLVGVDIGCGIHVSKLAKTKINFEKLDQLIRRQIPSGFKVRKTPHEHNALINLDRLRAKNFFDLERATLSIGTLGGGNHFIEMNLDEQKNPYLVIHSGSRHLGKQIADYYQKKAIQELNQKGKKPTNNALAYLEGETFRDYLHDMALAQKYADINRQAMAKVIIEGMGFQVVEGFTTIHNYIDLEEMILRKGAVSAEKRENLIIPINMRDGSILAVGKGNKAWNKSAPHGAGRLMSRRQARRQLSLEKFKASMEGIYTTSLSKATLDEAPFAYKPMQEIIKNIKDTVSIVDILRPIYNFKAAGD